jgi:hypothetical protein
MPSKSGSIIPRLINNFEQTMGYITGLTAEAGFVNTDFTSLHVEMLS